MRHMKQQQHRLSSKPVLHNSIDTHKSILTLSETRSNRGARSMEKRHQSKATPILLIDCSIPARMAEYMLEHRLYQNPGDCVLKLVRYHR